MKGDTRYVGVLLDVVVCPVVLIFLRLCFRSKRVGTCEVECSGLVGADEVVVGGACRL